MDLALNNLQSLICHKTHQTKPLKSSRDIDDQIVNVYIYKYVRTFRLLFRYYVKK